MHWNHAEFIPNHPSYIEFPSRMHRGPCLWRTAYWTRILTSPISRQAKPPQISPTIFQTHIRKGTIALTVEAARPFSNAHRVEERPSLPKPNISFSLQRGFYKSSQHTKNEGASARNKFRSYELFGVYQKDMPSVTNKLTARIPREISEGRKGGRKKGWRQEEGKKKRIGWLYWPQWFCAIGLRSISLLSKRLPLRLHYSGALSCYRGLWPGGMYPGRLPYPWLSLCSSVYTRLWWLHVRLCAPTGDGRGCVCGCITLIAGRGLSGEHREHRRGSAGWRGQGRRRLGNGRGERKRERGPSSLR